MKYLLISNEYSSRVIIGEEEDLLKILDLHTETISKIKKAIDAAYQEYIYESRRPASDFGITKTLEAQKRVEKLNDTYRSTTRNLINSYELYECNMQMQEAISPEGFLNAENKLESENVLWSTITKDFQTIQNAKSISELNQNPTTIGLQDLEKFAFALTFLLNQCVVINSSNEIIYVKGSVPYLIHSQGRTTNNIFKTSYCICTNYITC